MNISRKSLKAITATTIIAASAGCMSSCPEKENGILSLDVNFMSFNIRYDSPSDGENRWEKRKDFACDVVRDEAPDVVGLQEANRHQLDVFRTNLPEYAEVGIGRDGKRGGEYSAILYLHKRFDLTASGTFWLSETPTKPSQDWKSACRRICTWAQLTDKASRKSFFVYNTHLDHKSQLARMKGIKLIKDTMERQSAGHPAVLMGDFNVEEDNPVISFLNGSSSPKTSDVFLVDIFRAYHPDKRTVGTYHGFSGRIDGKRIDYIFATPGTHTLDATIVTTNRNGRYPSDHFPVTAHLRFDE